MRKQSAILKVIVWIMFLVLATFAAAANAANSYKTGISCGKAGCQQITRMNQPVAGKNCIKTTAGFRKTGKGAPGRNAIEYSGHYLCN
jgi:hypothetical protein